MYLFIFITFVPWRDGDHPIPANAKITYEIELLAVRDGPDMDTIPDEERIKIGYE